MMGHNAHSCSSYLMRHMRGKRWPLLCCWHHPGNPALSFWGPPEVAVADALIVS